MNTCEKASSCIVKNFENDDLSKLRLNEFNVNCGCEKPGTIYRPDIGSCVHHNPCTKQSLCREYGQECVNTASGHKCVCQLGFFRNGTNSCTPLRITETPPYHGFAHSESIGEL
uniref:EGF-like domain-containing protein n=1 Tax=Caenorhabditis japonica TaxID=281687 RepID=A0A8R1HNK3_CAEJA